MSFNEIRFETGYIVYGTDGGAEFSTDVVTVNSGYEQRNSVWQFGRGKWDFGDRTLPQNELREIISYFRAMKGRAIGFRFKDWGDYQVLAGEGILGTGVGNGMPSYQMYKKYVSGSFTDLRYIKKPVAGTTIPTRNGTPVTAGSSAGNYSIDTTTGIITFVADATSAASSITVGATTQVVLAANLGLIAGKLLYLSGFTGTDAALVNGIAHTINSVTGTGPYTFTLATNTAGKTITLGSGAGYSYPQASDVLVFTCEFDTPVRFDTDNIKYRFDGADITSPGTVGTGFFYLAPLPIVEIRV